MVTCRLTDFIRTSTALWTERRLTIPGVSDESPSRHSLVHRITRRMPRGLTGGVDDWRFLGTVHRRAREQKSLVWSNSRVYSQDSIRLSHRFQRSSQESCIHLQPVLLLKEADLHEVEENAHDFSRAEDVNSCNSAKLARQD